MLAAYALTMLWSGATTALLARPRPHHLDASAHRSVYRPTSFKANLISISGGWRLTVALDELGGVYVWGLVHEGQAGRLSVEPVGTPVFLQALAHEHIKKIACGSDVSYALSASGVLYQFGAVCRRRAVGSRGSRRLRPCAWRALRTRSKHAPREPRVVPRRWRRE